MAAVTGSNLAPRDHPLHGLLWKSAFAPLEAYPPPTQPALEMPVAVLYVKYEQLPLGHGDFIDKSCTPAGGAN